MTPPRRHAVTAITAIAALLAAAGAWAQAANAPQTNVVRVAADAAGTKLQVDGKDFMVFGMNWDYCPIGQNYMYNLWNQPDDFIEAALGREMPLLRGMGVNAIRVYAGIPPRWVRYIYERYGIYTVINHPIARYGYTLDGVWIPSVDYSNPRLRAALVAEMAALVDQFRGTPGVLMWLLGNENNYGLAWTSFEIEALPAGERDAARARQLYSLFGEIIRTVKAHDPDRPVAIANGDVQYVDIIAQECKGLDVFGTNVYRGISARDLFQVVHDKLGIPVMFTEFGSDAWNAKDMREDQTMQARYLVGQWREIYEQSSGKGRVGNAIGGFVFQWSDGWWKFGQESRLDIHDTNASWPNGGYTEDFVPGRNNMNEEWWGICAKGQPDDRGLYDEYPRAAYYALRRAFRLDPYAPGTDLAAIQSHFAACDPVLSGLEARGDRASLAADALERVRLSALRLEFDTFSTGGSDITTPPATTPQASLPSFRGFDHLESFYADLQVQPNPSVTGMLSVNVLGHVPLNRIDQLNYENQGTERVRLYRSNVSWDAPRFQLEGFYRTGHTHWGYEGDFFGLYRDAYYGTNIDIYNGEAPVGIEMTGKGELAGWKLAFGPQLWWGANPAFLLKYRRSIGSFDTATLYQEDLANQSSVTSSNAVPLRRTRKATLQVKTRRGPIGIEVGGIWSGSPRVDESFQIAAGTSGNYRILQDHVVEKDALGVKGKVTVERGLWHWYAQAAYMGLVADGGPTAPIMFTGWNLKDTGSGNQANAITGLAVNFGNFQFGPNFLWQKPIVGPVPGDVPSPGRPRNVLADPFAVRANRETVGGELVLAYDPTPATWMWAWDNDVREDARLAASIGVAVRHLPTTQDASIGILADGRTTFAFQGAPPPRDLWETRARLVSRLRSDVRMVTHVFAGTGEPNGNDPRVVHRYGADTRLAYGAMAFAASAKWNDWGPYDYHRDFNLTFPVQLMGDLSYVLGTPRWFDFPQTCLGARATWRTLDSHSPRYLAPPDKTGREWEIRTYLHVGL
jgi:hypothetical protein